MFNTCQALMQMEPVQKPEPPQGDHEKRLLISTAYPLKSPGLEHIFKFGTIHVIDHAFPMQM